MLECGKLQEKGERGKEDYGRVEIAGYVLRRVVKVGRFL